MAQIYRPTFYVDPATGKRVTKSFPGAARRKSKTWHVRYYTSDGQRHHAKGYTDRKATEALAANLERRAARLAEGLTDPLDAHAKRPLAEHAEDFRRCLEAKRNTSDYVERIAFRLSAVLDGCRFIHIGDVQPSAVLSFLADLRAGGKGLKTANDYLAAVKGFTRWLWRDKRTALDPLAGMPRLAAKGDPDIRHARRDLEGEELRRLLDPAATSPKTIRRRTGPDRYHLYLLAAATGFRAAELASLQPEAFDLGGDLPTVTVESTCAKNRKEAAQPLPADVAEVFRALLADKPAGKLIWPGRWHKKAFTLIEADLLTARQAWLGEAEDALERERREQSDFLSYCDAEGRYADFHCLRHTFISAVGKTGASPKVHQELARHSSYAMTGRYTHARLHDLAATVAGMPSLIPPAPSSTTAAATGTDGKSADRVCPNLCPQVAKTADFGRQTETDGTAPSPKENPGKQAVFAVFQGSKQEGQNVEARGIEPRSRGTSASASTCVACLFSTARPCDPPPRSPCRPPTSRVAPALTSCEV
jgi:integrase